MRFTFILVLLSFSICLIAQQTSDVSPQNTNTIFQDFKNTNASAVSLWKYSLLRYSTTDKRESILKIDQSPSLMTSPPTAFFCRIEDAIAKSSKVNMKFRLGSVQYVDALEGKGYFEALSYSRATNFQMTRNVKE